MGFIWPKLPPFDLHFWHWGRRSERLKPLCQHWGEHGAGVPSAVYLVHLLKIVGYVAGGLAFIKATPGIGTLAEIGTWWTAPVVFQKAVIWSLLFEILGLGCGFGPLTMRFLPPFGGFLYFLRPGTVRLPPWPGKVPLTRGTNRTAFDALLYLGILAAAVWLLLSPATRLDTDLTGPVMMLDPQRIVPLAVLIPLLGLRDKTIFLAARAEHYWITLLLFLLPFVDMVVGAKILMILIWWGAATSKLNRFFPFTVATMISNAPLVPKAIRRRLFRSFPNDMRPSRLAGAGAWLGTMIEFGAPLVMLVSTNRTVTLVAIVVMVLFHLNITVSVPFGVPLEWNVFIIFSLVYLFWGHSSLDLGNSAHPLLPALIAIPVVITITWGNLRPDQVSFLPSMRYYAGNWPTTMWALERSAIAKVDDNIVKYSGFAKDQLARLYGEQVAELFAHKVYTFRALHHHGRGMFGLLPRAVGPDHEDAFVMEGELVAGAVLGWDFGDGHLHNEQLISAMQERCNFEPGEVRVVVLESAPIGSDRQEYRLVDAATGVFERGYVLVDDMVNRQPWDIEDLPAHVVYQVLTGPDEWDDTWSQDEYSDEEDGPDLPAPKASGEQYEPGWSAPHAGTA
ncbi:DUF3556 domain-containing protein [Pseudonocardia spinosispora]|uniref:DUF3556 domain-containing protein n=1 Tax=Pseudonocardia spinosispora TaxID=103441 RepID=UPI00041B54F4|nr:DUF3556 domain-containing protein [Pseudonocardia spinosispora]